MKRFRYLDESTKEFLTKNRLKPTDQFVVEFLAQGNDFDDFTLDQLQTRYDDWQSNAVEEAWDRVNPNSW